MAFFAKNSARWSLPAAILAAPGGANAAAPLLALELGGEIFMGVISGVAFATILAVVAGLAITGGAVLALPLVALSEYLKHQS